MCKDVSKHDVDSFDIIFKPHYFKSSCQPRKEAQPRPLLAKPDGPWGQFGLKCHEV